MKLLYLDEFNVVICDARVTDVQATEDGRTDVQLNQTCFYPRGGGQDWDTGLITNSDESNTFEVQEVRLDEQGVVHHLGSFRSNNSGHFNTGASVICRVNRERRSINTRLHSAGHVVDMAVDELKLPWTPQKGGHYPHLSNIPANKPARVVIYNGNFGVPCGGTHVKNIQEIGSITITKIKAKKGVVKVSYAVEGIN